MAVSRGSDILGNTIKPVSTRIIGISIKWIVGSQASVKIRQQRTRAKKPSQQNCQSQRTPRQFPQSGSACHFYAVLWVLVEVHRKLVCTLALTLTLSPGEREQLPTSLDNSFVSIPIAAVFLFVAKTALPPDASAPPRRGERFSLSSGERAGVRAVVTTILIPARFRARGARKRNKFRAPMKFVALVIFMRRGYGSSHEHADDSIAGCLER